jgi:uncharacterized protein
VTASLTLMTGLLAGLLVAAVTAPVGVSGAVFLLPIQLTVLQVPNPAVTPTNLLFNILATPGALARYRRRASLRSPLTTTLLAGTVPGVMIGAVIRVFLLPGPRLFRIVVAALLLPVGVWLCLGALIRPRTASHDGNGPSSRFIAILASLVGVIGGIYGIGGGSLLSPILVGRGLSTRIVAPAALTTTFITSIIGALTYTVIATTSSNQHIAPHWGIGLFAGFGGLIGGYFGARLQPKLPERILRIVLGVLALSTALLYIWQAVV